MSQDFVAFSDVLLNFKTLKTQPFCAEVFLTSSYDFKYDASLECPFFLEFLDEIFKPFADRKKLLQCVLKAILWKKTQIKKIINLFGPSKSEILLLLKIVRSIVGE